MKLICIIFILLFVAETNGQQRKPLIKFEDTSSGEAFYGYKNYEGKIIIPAQFDIASDTLNTIAFVAKNGTWLGISQKNEIVLVPYIYDNGPDYVEEGLMRYVENNKIGFANSAGKKIIPAQFDFVTPFKKGKANYTQGGKKVYEAGGEYWTWQGGYETGFVNKKGKRFGIKHFLVNKK
jgi:WG containing repeat